ncbi:unnamed protein product [Medioppia subpectinata]|uniref:Neurotransmitter-gated ion-channel transmembrane domain-containing protein n=1 Tax=Medioppia subpectinata TaxID=1979941 RepID=A0A7R9Q8W0_9ACAR|nr:unnamed protein product [Medioppia subpectinata]CAG2116279.1 unnamed protein product [Medioppia subpectinata]
MEITATPARITLGITTMLTFVTVAKEARERLPNISYVNALDIWFVVCTGFIFLSLIEFSVVTYISRAEKRKIKEIKTMRRTLSQSQLSLVSGDSQLTIQANDIKNRQNISRFSFEGIELKVPQSPRLNSGLTLTVPSSPVTKRNYLTITPPETPETPNFDRQTPSTPSYDPLKRTPVEIAESIDRKCRIVFPIMFVVFNLVYWTTILLS